MRARLVGLGPVLVASLLACGKPIPREKSAYVGTWSGDGMALSISRDGLVAYSRNEAGLTKSLNAPLQAFQGDDFVVGVGPLSTTFVVSSAPRQEAGSWTMTVDGVELTRK
jgi:hypothetical protein